MLAVSIGEVMFITWTFFSIKEVVRIEHSKVVWGKISSFQKLAMKKFKVNEDPQPTDYRIEVEFEYNGMTHRIEAVTKKEIHYEPGGKIKVFLPGGKIESAIINTNIKVGAYISLIMSVFMTLFIMYEALFVWQ